MFKEIKVKTIFLLILITIATILGVNGGIKKDYLDCQWSAIFWMFCFLIEILNKD